MGSDLIDQLGKKGNLNANEASIHDRFVHLWDWFRRAVSCVVLARSFLSSDLLFFCWRNRIDSRIVSQLLREQLAGRRTQACCRAIFGAVRSRDVSLLLGHRNRQCDRSPWLRLVLQQSQSSAASYSIRSLSSLSSCRPSLSEKTNTTAATD